MNRRDFIKSFAVGGAIVLLPETVLPLIKEPGYNYAVMDSFPLSDVGRIPCFEFRSQVKGGFSAHGAYWVWVEDKVVHTHVKRISEISETVTHSFSQSGVLCLPNNVERIEQVFADGVLLPDDYIGKHIKFHKEMPVTYTNHRGY